jgi:hypothetical protein
MTNKQLSPEAQALKDAVKTLYQDDKCAEMGWETDKPTIVVALRELVNQLQYYNCLEGEDMLLDARAILEVADELEAL